MFHEGLDLPEFAAFDLLKDEEGTEALRRYYGPFAELALETGAGLLLESPPGVPGRPLWNPIGATCARIARALI
jgi:homocysteine S-methyltransferase